MINIINAIDYYPFGWVMPGRELVSSNKYRFGYQGEFSEKDEEIGWNQFELRSLDTRVGRWMSPDPYHQYASPYMAMGNNPIRRVDPDGGIDEPISLPEISNNEYDNLNNQTSYAIADDWLLKNNGELVLLEYTNDNYHTIYNEQGDVIWGGIQSDYDNNSAVYSLVAFPEYDRAMIALGNPINGAEFEDMFTRSLKLDFSWSYQQYMLSDYRLGKLYFMQSNMIFDGPSAGDDYSKVKGKLFKGIVKQVTHKKLPSPSAPTKFYRRVHKYFYRDGGGDLQESKNQYDNYMRSLRNGPLGGYF